MAWSKSKDPFAEQSVKNTNILFSPWGKGNPASSKEYNVNFLIRTQAEQELYRSLMPSGFLSRVTPVTTLETTTGTDTDAELVALTTNSSPVANTLRLGRADVLVNGWKIHVTNTDGTNGVHNNIVLDTAPSTAGRTDLVFLEVWVAELGGTSASISNTTNKPSATTIYAFGNRDFKGTNVTDDISEVDAEINRRWQVQYRIRKVNGVSIDTFIDGVDDTVNVKAWGANPNNTWTGSTAGVGSSYTFSNMGSDSQFPDVGLWRAGDGSTVAQSTLGTVDGYVYVIPIAAVFRRNSGQYNTSTNALGSATAVAGTGNIASAVSGRPDGLFYDQVAEFDIQSLRHGVAAQHDFEQIESQALDRLMRGNLMSYFGIGDNVGAPGGTGTSPYRGTLVTYTEGLSAVDQPLINDFSQYNYQRRIFSDAAVVQQTPFYFTGVTTDLNDTTHFSKPFNVNAPAQPTGTASTVSGTLAAGTYLVKVTYTNQFGETTPSTESAGIVLGATGNITVNSPATSTGATGWNVYITSGATNTETKQNGGTPIAIGTNYTQSVPLVAGAALPASNTASSTLNIAVSSVGLVNGTATGTCVDGSATAGAGSLPGSVNILVYDASTNAAATGTWSGLGTASPKFTVTGQWTTSITTNGCVAIIGVSIPAGNGLHFRPHQVTQQAVTFGGVSSTNAQIGVTGVTKAQDGYFNLPKDVWVDSSGNIYVADSSNHRVVKYNSSFVKQAQFGVTGTSGADNSHLNNPISVVTDSVGNVYVSDQSNQRVVKLNSSLAYVGQFGVTAVSGADTAHLNSPNQIRVDGSDNIYIADGGNLRVLKITNALAFSATSVSGLTSAPTGLAVDTTGTQIWLTQGHAAQKYTSGALTWTFGVIATAGSDNFHLNTPRFMALDNQANIPAGGIIVCDVVNNRLVKINSNGILFGQLGVTNRVGTDVGKFQNAFGVAVDSSNAIYVADQNNHRIVKQHIAMGAVDPPLRQLEVLTSGASTDTLNTTYQYRPYQGVIGAQGSTLMNYTVRALTDLKFFASTLGTAGRNAVIEDNLNGSLTRFPLPKGAFGTSPSTLESEFKFAGTAIAFTGQDSSGILSDPSVSWGGGMATFGPAAGTDIATFQGGPVIVGQTLKLSQSTLAAGYPNRGVNTLQKFSEFLTPTSTLDTIGLSFGTLTGAAEHLNVAYCLAVCSGGNATLPVLKGEVVLLVITFRPGVSTSTGVYTYTNVAVAVDLFRVTQRTLIRY